jgi:serine/threonine protein kinase
VSARETPCVDEIWMEVVQLDGERRARRLTELCAGDPERERAVQQLLEDAPRPLRLARELPCQLGPYTLLERIADGAHGEVFRATRGDLDGQIALKLLKRSSATPRLVEAVRKEASAARRIPSEHVVAVHDAGQIAGGPHYIEMELCADADPVRPGAIRLGTSLRHVAATARGTPTLTAEEAARLVEDLCKGAEAAHRAGVVHGDIKPENVLVTPETRRVMLADFGIATTLATHAASAGGVVRVGTLEYMAPEQFHEGRLPDVAADVYMLGGTLLFTLTGQVPHPDRRVGPAGVSDGPRTPVPRRVPERLAEIVERALAVDPAARFRSAAEMADELRRFRELRPTSGDARHPFRRLTLLCRRHSQVLTALSVTVVISLAVGIAGYRVLQGAVVAARAQVEALTRDGELLKGGNADLERRRAELEVARARLEAQVAHLENRARQAQAELAELPAVRAERDETRGKLAAASSRASEADRLAAQRLEEIGNLRGQLTAAAAEVDRLRADALAAAERLESASERSGALEARAAFLDSAVRALDSERDALRARVEALGRDLSAATARAAALEATVDELRGRTGATDPSVKPRTGANR